MNKQELIALYERVGNFVEAVKVKDVIDKLKQLDEPQKVTVPQYVADWIEYCKTKGIALGYALYCSGQASDKKAYDWIVESFENQETFALAWINGYTVEKEKRYIVKMKGMNKSSTILKLDKILGSWYLGEDAEYSYTKDAHTRKELEEAGFGGVFDSPLFEVEEVEGGM